MEDKAYHTDQDSDQHLEPLVYTPRVCPDCDEVDEACACIDWTTGESTF